MSADPSLPRNDQFKSTLRRALFVPLLLLAIAPLLLIYTIYDLVDVIGWNRHTVEVLLQVSKIQSNLVDMETGVRGYQLTGDVHFLEPYNRAATVIDADAKRLGELIRDNAAQIERFQKVETARTDWQRHAAETIRKLNAGETLLPEESIKAKGLMDELRGLLGSLSSTETSLLRVRSAAASRAEGWAAVVLLGSFLVIAVIVAWWVSRQIWRLNRSHQAVVAEIHEQKEWFHVTLSSIGDAVIVTDRDGRVAFINSEAERMTGWEWNDAKNKPLKSIFRIVNEDSRQSVDDPVEKVFRENRVVGLANHTLLISKSGVEWPIEDSAAPVLDSSRQIIGVVLVFHDATEMRKAQRVMKTYSEDLERKVVERTLELHRTVGELQAFSYSVSHDLRAPLRAMQGFSNLLMEDHANQLDETGRDYLRRIAKGAERLDRLVQDILIYSSVGEKEAPIKTVDLDALVTEVIQVYPGIREHEAAISVASPLHKVVGHEAGLTQIISNLLVNAIKFADPARALRIAIRTEVRPNTICLWIEDNGIGINPEHLARIFRIFEQVDPKQSGGTGIGLAIVQKAAERMHGSVGVNSTPGKGSQFWVELVKPAGAAE